MTNFIGRTVGVTIHDLLYITVTKSSLFQSFFGFTMTRIHLILLFLVAITISARALNIGPRSSKVCIEGCAQEEYGKVLLGVETT
jgi:hypothetical protein